MLVLSTLSLSVLSYNFIEQPFRKKGNIKTLHLLAILFIGTLTSSLYGLYIYQKAGVLRDVPELNAYIGNTQRGQHALYNSRGYKLDNPFVSSSKKKVLIVGNSQGRDWINVLLESRFSDKIEVSYLSNVDDLKKEVHRINVADVVFFDSPKPSTPEEYGIPRSKFWAIGCKNFGASNGYFFNYRGDDYYMQRVEISKQILDLHLELKHQWKNRYMNYLDKVIDANNKVPVFTPDKKFISQDCRHLTQAGAIFFAKLFEGDLARVFEDEQIIKGK